MSYTKTKVLHMATIDLTVYKVLMDKMNYLRRYGYEISFASNKGNYLDIITAAGYKFHHISIPREIHLFKDIVAIYKTYNLIRREKFDIVHTHTSKAGFIGRVAAKLAHVPVIVHTSHGLPFYQSQNKIKYAMYLMIEKLASRFSSLIFSQNYEDMKNMREHNFKPKHGIEYEGNGVDITRIGNFILNSNSDIRKELNIAKNDVVIGYYARFEPVKGHKLFIEAYKQVAERCSNVVCFIAGSGYLEEEIKKEIKENGLESRIRFLGFREDILNVLKATDIVVLASEKEGIPRIIMEAMCLGKPVVATNVLGTKELVVDNHTGYLVEYGNRNELSQKVVVLVQNEELRIQFGTNGHDRILSEFTEEIVAQRINKVYKVLLSRSGFKE